MNTPIYDFLSEFCCQNINRCFMPGHKGKSLKKGLENLYKYDITEIKNADSLFESNGIIAESEKNASELFNTEYTAFSTSGSTLCIQAMLTVMKWENRKALAVRNVHRSFLNASALLDLEVEWIYSEYSDSILSGEIDCDYLEKRLQFYKNNSFVYITSPDYTGKIYDIKKISEICKKYDARLIVDNAHGVLLPFMPENIHPIKLGADMCCDSAHKMLPTLTGSAYLHTSRREYVKLIKKAMLLFASTSPSYLIMMSLDLCNKYISENIKDDITKNLKYISELKSKFSNDIKFAEGEPFHITIKASESGFDGKVFADFLRLKSVECEYADSEYVILLMSPLNEAEDYKKLSDSIEYAIKNSPKKPTSENSRIYIPNAPKRMSIRDAVFSQSEEIPVEYAEGRICSGTNVPCPPAVPIALSGEIITDDIIKVYKKYGILSVNVVK